MPYPHPYLEMELEDMIWNYINPGQIQIYVNTPFQSGWSGHGMVCQMKSFSPQI